MCFGGHGGYIGQTFELGPAYGSPEVWKRCSLAAAHTHTQIATRTLLRSTNLRVNNDFYLHYESRSGTVYTVTRCKRPKFKKCVRKMVLNVHIKTYMPIHMYER